MLMSVAVPFSADIVLPSIVKSSTSKLVSPVRSVVVEPNVNTVSPSVVVLLTNSALLTPAALIPTQPLASTSKFAVSKLATPALAARELPDPSARVAATVTVAPAPLVTIDCPPAIVKAFRAGVAAEPSVLTLCGTLAFSVTNPEATSNPAKLKLDIPLLALPARVAAVASSPDTVNVTKLPTLITAVYIPSPPVIFNVSRPREIVC